MQKPIAWTISTFRAKKTKEMYKQIGGGSLIFDITMRQASELERSLNSSTNQPIHPSIKFKVYVGMRYWYPFIGETVKKINDDGIKKIIALSLYPHYSLATTGSSYRELEKVLKSYPIQCSYIKSWPENPLYIKALIERIEEGLRQFNDCSDILFSAHGLPVDFIKRGDPYVDEINKTIKAIKNGLNNKINFHLSYQSRSGPVKWLEPSTDEMIGQLSKQGVQELLVVPISFVSDHIETLYEIDILYKNLARDNGIILKRIESLNTHPLFIKALKLIVIESLSH